MLRGIDVSTWQGEIDWNAVSSRIDFAIIKAAGSDAGFYSDPRFARNRSEAGRLGLPRGYYYFAGGGDPAAEAGHFYSAAGPLGAGELAALDFEIEHPDPVGYCLAFLQRAEQLFGVRPLLYTNMGRVWRFDWSPVAAGNYGLWGAIWDGNDAPPHPGAWPYAAIKQYTSRGVLPGITVNTVDMNVFYGDAAAWRRYGRQAAATAGTPAPPAPPPVHASSPRAPDPGTGFYTVRPGDTLSEIAADHGMGLGRLLQLNPAFRANPDLIFPGQVLTLSGGAGTYIVQPGDTLSGIAMWQGISLAELLGKNPRFEDPDLIFPGDRVFL